MRCITDNEYTGNNNSFLAKSKIAGGVQFSRDPLNLINKNTRKHAGFVNAKVHTQITPEGPNELKC